MNINTTYSGILNIDKPQGITSHDVINRVRHVAGMRKVGHAGTLDPMATGVLLVLLGKATRLMEYAHDLQKTYRATITLGGTSDTDDATGKITAQKITAKPTPDRIQQILPSFTGNIQQIPPSYAAIKVRGRKLYEYARQNKAIEKKPRPITIYGIELLSYSYPDIDARIICGSGTYIRSLARDLGVMLETGAYLSKLKREAIGDFKIQEAVSLDKLTTKNIINHLIKPKKLVSHLPPVTLSPEEITKASYGQALPCKIKSLKANQPVALFAADNSLVGIGDFDAATSLIQPHKILNL